MSFIINILTWYDCIVGRNQWKNFGVSVNISASYLRGIPGGETARVEVTTERVGKTLANFYVKIFDAKDRLCYTGNHTVFCTDPKIWFFMQIGYTLPRIKILEESHSNNVYTYTLNTSNLDNKSPLTWSSCYVFTRTFQESSNFHIRKRIDIISNG